MKLTKMFALSIGLFADYAGWREAFFLVGLASVGLGLGWIRIVKTTDLEIKSSAKKSVNPSRNWQKVLLVVAITATVGGFIFNSMTVSLPKVLDDTLSGFAMSSTEVGAIASVVYALAAFTQIVVGNAIDKYRIKPIFLAFVAAQAVFLYLASFTNGWLMVLISLVIMVLVFGQIPINDTLIARYTPDTWRGRVYSVKYVLTFTVSAAVVPSIAWLYDDSGGFTLMFTLSAIAALIITVAVLAMPRGQKPAASLASEGDDD